MLLDTHPRTAISLQELVSRISTSRWIIPACAAVGLAAALAAWIAMPRTYVSEATLLPSSGQESGAMSSGLLSVAGSLGFRLPGGAVPESHLDPTILNSERILRAALLTPLDPDDPAAGRLLDRLAGGDQPAELRLEGAIGRMRHEILRVALDSETGIVRVTVQMNDPDLANRTAAILIGILETYLAQDRHSSQRRNLEFVESRREEAEAALAKAEGRLKDFRDANRQIGNSPDLMLVEGRLLRDVQVQEQVFLEMTRQYEIARIDALKASPILEILDPPTIHHTPRSPRLFVLLGVGLLLGILIGSIAAAVLETPRPGLRSFFSTARALLGRGA